MKKDLEKLWWYRLGCVIKYFIVALALLVPSISGGLWYFDGVINALIWYLILKVIWLAIKYVAYGKSPTKEMNDEKLRSVRIFALSIFAVLAYLLAVYAAMTTTV